MASATTAALLGVAATLSAVLLGASVPAIAQTPSPLAEWQYSAGVPLEQLFVPKPPAWQAQIGGALSLEPLYDGADRYRTMPGMIADLRYRDLFFASTGEGVGVNVFHGRHYRIGLALAYDLGRREAEDRAQLQGLGDIQPAPELKLFGEYVISKQLPLVLRVDIRRALGGSEGWIGDLGAYLPLPGSSERFQWFAGPTVTFADRRYMQSYFGVGVAQSTRTGLPRYDAAAGLKSYGFGLSATWFFLPHWLLEMDAAVSGLAGSAAKSPSTRARTSGAVDFGLAWSF